VSTLKAKDAECEVSSTLDKQISSKVESIINRRCEGLHETIASKQEEMNHIVQKLTSDVESQIEALRSEISVANQDKKLTSQLTISNAEVAMYVSNLCTIVDNLSLKVSSSQGRHDSNEGTIIEGDQHVGEDDFEMIP
jgi:DNA gyrase/topoisomerase IV subunit A